MLVFTKLVMYKTCSVVMYQLRVRIAGASFLKNGDAACPNRIFLRNWVIEKFIIVYLNLSPSHILTLPDKKFWIKP